MEDQIHEFKHKFREAYPYVSSEADDDMILEFIETHKGDIDKAIHLFYDYLLAEGLGDVQL